MEEKHYSGDGYDVVAVGRHKCSAKCITDKQITPQISKKCRLNREGLNTFHKNKQGRVIGESMDKKCWIIVWNGEKSARAYSKDFIYVYVRN